MKYSEEEGLRWHNSLPTKRVASSVLFRNSDGKVLIVKPNYRDYWNFPGGVVESNESPLDGAIRETKEEIGILISPATLTFLAVDYGPKQASGKNDILSIDFDGGILSDSQIDNIIIQAEELDEYRFVDESELGTFLKPEKAKRIYNALKSKTAIYLENGEYRT